MRALVACEFSGIVRDAFRAKGHDAWSCDIIPTEGDSAYHIQGDVLRHLDEGWDLLIAHPPCTRLCNSGVRWLNTPPKGKSKIDMNRELRNACQFFSQMLNCPIPRRCVENPIPHKHARQWVGTYTQLIQPWQFGHGETKATCLWLRNLPPLRPTKIVKGRKPRVHHESPGPDRWKNRSRTYQGIGNAMAEQWGGM